MSQGRKVTVPAKHWDDLKQISSFIFQHNRLRLWLSESFSLGCPSLSSPCAAVYYVLYVWPGTRVPAKMAATCRFSNPLDIDWDSGAYRGRRIRRMIRGSSGTWQERGICRRIRQKGTNFSRCRSRISGVGQSRTSWSCRKTRCRRLVAWRENGVAGRERKDFSRRLHWARIWGLESEFQWLQKQKISSGCRGVFEVGKEYEKVVLCRAVTRRAWK